MSKQQRDGRIVLGVMGGVILVCLCVAVVNDRTEARAFQSMTPAAHLAAAKDQPRFAWDKLRHLEAIPASAPESTEALRMIENIRLAQQAEAQAAKLRQQRENDIRTARPIAARNLQDELRNLGYAVDISCLLYTSDAADE